MRLNLKTFALSLFTVTLMMPALASAQTPDASPVAGDTGWEVTGSREIDVDGQPIALSPDGQWLAGVRGENDQEVCAWDVETLTPTCAEVEGLVRPYIGNSLLQWAPDSTAFAFSSGDFRLMEIGDVFVFELETGELTQLTNNVDGEQALVIGASWTSDSQQVVFAINHGLGEGMTEIRRADRTGGSVETIALPAEWPADYDILTPPHVTQNGSLLVAVTQTDADIAGIWKLDRDGANPEQLMAAHGDPPVTHPMIASTSPDGQYLNVISVDGIARMMEENTYYLLDAESGDQTSLDVDGTPQMIVFAPTSDAGLLLRDVDGELQLQAIDLATGEASPVANSPADMSLWLQFMPTWAENNTVFIPTEGLLLTLEAR